MKKIYILIIALFLLITKAYSDELSYMNVDNSNIEISMPDEILPATFTPPLLAKDEKIFKSSKAKINYINPTIYTNRAGKALPGLRGNNQLIIYTSSFGKRTNTNEFGAEAIVENNTVTELSGADSYIPENGVVISGHGSAKAWMHANVKIGSKVYVNNSTKELSVYTTSESYIFETEKKIAEAEQLIQYYRTTSADYNWRLPYSYIDDAKDNLKKAKRHPAEVQKYSQLAIENANDALKSVLPYKNGELKGIWVRPTEKTEAEIISTINRIQNAGINNIFLETYFHGKTIFPSKTMSAYGFINQNEQFTGTDVLAIWIREAHKRGIKIHTWFETFYAGNQNPQDNQILAKNPSWGNKMKKDALSSFPSKSPLEHNGFFLDPANPYVQDFLIKLIEEIIAVYKPDGVNLDYIRYPNCLSGTEATNWGYTAYAREDFQKIYGIDPINLSKNDYLWQEWDKYRRDQITNMVKKAGELGRKTNTYVSAVIFPDIQSALTTKHQDWKSWTTREYVNGFTPLFLTCNSQVANSMISQILKVKSPNTDLYAGLFVTFMNGSDEDLIRLIHETRKLNAKGVVLFDYAHLNDKYINTLSKSVFAPSIRTQRHPCIDNVQNDKHKGWWIFK